MTNVLTIGEKVKQDLYPSLVSGFIAAGIFKLAYGESISAPIPVFGFDLPAGLVIGGAVAGSHLVGNILEENVLSMLKSNKADMIGAAVKPVLSGLATYGVLQLTVGGDIDLMQSVMIGAGSVFAGEYAYNNILKKV